MNKQQAFTIIAILGAIGIAGLVLLLIIAPESADKFGDWVIMLLGILAGFAGLTYMQGKQGDVIAEIKHQTNGTLSKRDDEIAALRAALQEQAPEALARIDSGAVRVIRVSDGETLTE